MGVRFRYLMTALFRECITPGTTEQMMTSSTCPTSSPKHWKYSRTCNPISSEVRVAPVTKRKLLVNRSF
jgi:hypothetical protein